MIIDWMRHSYPAITHRCHHFNPSHASELTDAKYAELPGMKYCQSWTVSRKFNCELDGDEHDSAIFYNIFYIN